MAKAPTGVADEIALEPAPGIRIVWDQGLIESHARGEGDDGWSLDGPIGSDVAAVRVLTAAGAEGGALLIAGVRPVGAEGHDTEHLAALLGDSDGSLQPVKETLISTEYATEGRIRRIGLELYLPGEDYALRAAGDAVGYGESDRDGAQLSFTSLDFRLDGQRGAGRLDLLRRAS